MPILISVLFIFLGLVMVVAGVRFHLGHFRKPLVYWSTFSSAVYATAPLGVGLILLGIELQLPSLDLRRAFAIPGMLIGLIGIVLAITMPQFATPWWFRYLRETYDEWFIMAILMNDAAKNYAWWKENTKTKEGLISWANEVQQKTRIEET